MAQVTYIEPKEVARLVRTTLKETFGTETKFSVSTQTDQYRNGITVNWTDGPDVKSVNYALYQHCKLTTGVAEINGKQYSVVNHLDSISFDRDYTVDSLQEVSHKVSSILYRNGTLRRGGNFLAVEGHGDKPGAYLWGEDIWLEKQGMLLTHYVIGVAHGVDFRLGEQSRGKQIDDMIGLYLKAEPGQKAPHPRITDSAKTDLEIFVAEWIDERSSEQDGDTKEVLEELMQGGCASGYVNQLIRTVDCRQFVTRFMGDIEELINDLIENAGGAEWLTQNSRGDTYFSFDKIAWVAFEETARNLASKTGIEI